MLLGSAVATLMHSLLSPEQIQTWGWRLPFLGGGLVVVVGWWMRRGVQETPEFTRLRDAGRIESSPILQALREMPLRVLQVAGLVLLFGTSVYILFVWMPTYLTHFVEPPVPYALLINTLCTVILIATMPVAGMLADQFGYKIVFGAATLVTGLLVYPLFVWIDYGTVIGASVALTVFALTNGCIQGAMPLAMADMFPPQLRFSGMAIGYNLTL